MRLKLKQTDLASNVVPSWNFTPWRSLNVHARPFLEVVQLVASDGTTFVVPGFSPTSPSNIWLTARSEGPSETSAPSTSTGSPSVPKTNVSLACDLLVAANAAAVANSATAAERERES